MVFSIILKFDTKSPALFSLNTVVSLSKFSWDYLPQLSRIHFLKTLPSHSLLPPRQHHGFNVLKTLHYTHQTSLESQDHTIIQSLPGCHFHLDVMSSIMLLPLRSKFILSHFTLWCSHWEPENDISSWAFLLASSSRSISGRLKAGRISLFIFLVVCVCVRGWGCASFWWATSCLRFLSVLWLPHSCNSHPFLKQQLNPVYLFSNTCRKSFNSDIRTSCQFLHLGAVCPGPTAGAGGGCIFDFLDTQSSSVKVLPQIC